MFLNSTAFHQRSGFYSKCSFQLFFLYIQIFIFANLNRTLGTVFVPPLSVGSWSVLVLLYIIFPIYMLDKLVSNTQLISGVGRYLLFIQLGTRWLIETPIYGVSDYHQDLISDYQCGLDVLPTTCLCVPSSSVAVPCIYIFNACLGQFGRMCVYKGTNGVMYTSSPPLLQKCLVQTLYIVYIYNYFYICVPSCMSGKNSHILDM